MGDPKNVLTNEGTSDLANELVSGPEDSGQNLDETLSHAANAPEIHQTTPAAILAEMKDVVVEAVSSLVKISVIDVMTDRSNEIVMNHLRLADATIVGQMKAGTIDMKTELNETNLAPRGVILHR